MPPPSTLAPTGLVASVTPPAAPGCSPADAEEGCSPATVSATASGTATLGVILPDRLRTPPTLPVTALLAWSSQRPLCEQMSFCSRCHLPWLSGVPGLG